MNWLFHSTAVKKLKVMGMGFLMLLLYLPFLSLYYIPSPLERIIDNEIGQFMYYQRISAGIEIVYYKKKNVFRTTIKTDHLCYHLKKQGC